MCVYVSVYTLVTVHVFVHCTCVHTECVHACVCTLLATNVISFYRQTIGYKLSLDDHRV